MSLSRSDAIAAGVEIVRADGAEGLGTHSVARRLGIKPPSVYNHVTSKADLHHAVAVQGYGWLAQALGRHGSARASDDAPETLRRLARAYRDFALSEPRLYTFLASAELDPTDPDCQETIGRVLEPFESALGALGYQGAEAVHALRGLRAGVHGFVVLELSGQFSSSPRVGRSFEALLDTLIRFPKKGRDA